MQTNDQKIAVQTYMLLDAFVTANNYGANAIDEYVRIIRWLPSMLSQAGCETTFEFLYEQAHSGARNADIISIMCTHICELMNVPTMTETEYINIYANGTQNVRQDEINGLLPIRRIQHHLEGLSTDQYIQFVQRLFGVMVWLKRLAVSMQPA